MNHRTPSHSLRGLLAGVVLVSGFAAPAFAGDQAVGRMIADGGKQALSEIREQMRQDLHQSLRRPVDALARFCLDADIAAGGADEEIRLNTGAVGPRGAYHSRHG
jgi:hypothetical protein